MRQIKDNLKDLKPYIPGKTVEGAVKLASNENALGCSPKATQAVKEFADRLNLYPDGYCSQLRITVSNQMKISSNQLIFGNGSDELLLLIAGAFVDNGDEVITSESTFSEYTFSTKVFAGQMKYAAMKEFCFDLMAIQKLITDKTRLIYLCNPNNPTGTYFSNLEAFMSQISKDIIVVVDEAYYEYVEAADFPDTIKMIKNYDNLIVLRTFSKIYGLAALRIGYGIASPEIIDMIGKVKEPFNINALAQVAALAAMDDHDFVKRSLENNKQGKEYLFQELDKIGLKYLPTQTNFIFIYDLPMSGKDIFEKLMDEGLIIRPMDSFGYINAIRVTIGTPKQNRLFIEKIRGIL